MSTRHRITLPNLARSCRSNNIRPRSSGAHVNSDKVKPVRTFTHPLRQFGAACIRLVKTPLDVYNSMQKRNPYLTQFETGVVAYFLGDTSAQAMQTGMFSDGSYEPVRGLRAMVIGGIASIPSYRYFLWLGRHFNYSSSARSLATKIVFNQCVFAPSINGYYFLMQGILSGDSVAGIWDRIRGTLPVSWLNSWRFWPFVTAFSFTFASPQNRSAVAGVALIFWQTYLSWLNRRAELTKRDAMAVESGLG